jgi:glycosyltransferase involved in cell wall biosynthesis
MPKYDNFFESSKSCVILPTYNNEKALEKVVSGILEYCSFLIVVNDGSTDATEEILAKFTSIKIISYKKNRGKGYAIKKGLKLAEKEGFENAITIDSDGQHYPEDLILFLQEAEKNPGTIIIGARKMEGQNQAGGSSFANKFSNFWFRAETFIKIPDSQSGYRLYPVKKINKRFYFTNRYEFEIEVLVRAVWRGIEIKNVPVNVFYPNAEDRISHFKPGKDFFRISLLNTALVLIAVLYGLPAVAYHTMKRKTVKGFLKEHILSSSDSNLRLAVAVGFGIFMGIVPVWGWQLLTALGLAHVFKLNKPIVGLAAQISIPPMIPLILFGSYYTGALILGNDVSLLHFKNEIDFAMIKQDVIQYIIGSFALATIAGIIATFISFFIISIFRKNLKPAEVKI